MGHIISDKEKLMRRLIELGIVKYNVTKGKYQVVKEQTVLVDGRLVTVGEGSDGAVLIDMEQFDWYCTDVQKAVLKWFEDCIVIDDTKGTSGRLNNSYTLKHILQSYTGIYLTNNAFKHAMGLAGIIPRDAYDRFWVVKIDKKAPIRTEVYKPYMSNDMRSYLRKLATANRNKMIEDGMFIK